MASDPLLSAGKPVLFDLQVNGFAGVDFQRLNVSVNEMEHAVRALHNHRTGKILLTLITDTIDNLCRKLEHFEYLRRQSESTAETVIGYHIEGPWLLPEPGFMGAHNPDCMTTPSIPDFDRLNTAANGHIRLLTLAPELTGSPELIEHCTRRGVKVAIGHSNASEEAIDIAIAAGMTLCTHLGNGVPSHLHRHDNVIQRLLTRDELTAVFIPDGIHLPPHVLKNFVRAKPQDKVLFTTDCMAAAGAPAGTYSLGEISIEVGEDRVVREPGKSNFAGSSLTMDNAVTNIVQYLDWSPEQALLACSTGIAEVLGIAAELSE